MAKINVFDKSGTSVRLLFPPVDTSIGQYDPCMTMAPPTEIIRIQHAAGKILGNLLECQLLSTNHDINISSCNGGESDV